MDSSYIESQMLIYGNILIDDQERLELFKLTLPGWLEFWDSQCLLRIRGKLACEASAFASQFARVTVNLDSHYLQWRFQSYVDLKEVNSTYVVIFLEDHLILSDKSKAPLLLKELESKAIDIFQYSWFMQYSGFRTGEIAFELQQGNLGTYSTVDKSFVRSLPESHRTQFCSLSSVFRRDFLVELLSSSRPWVRKYDPRSPFDVEQSPNSTWYLPINFGLPNFEIAACIDDDNGVAGYSLVSRGMFTNVTTKRGISHHPHRSFYTLFKLIYIYFEKHQNLNFISAIFRNVAISLLATLTTLHYSFAGIYIKIYDQIQYLRYIRKFQKARQGTYWGHND